MAIDYDQKIFGSKKYSDILKEIYDRTKTKETQINALIDQLKHLIQPENINDKLSITPLIHSYLESGLKNDKLLIEMCAIIQKGIDRGKEVGESNVTDQERDDLLRLAAQLSAENQVTKGKNLPAA